MSELRVHASHQGQMRVVAGTEKHQVVMDYPMEPRDAVAGMTPLQMLLASLAACSVNTVMLVLQKMAQPVEGLDVDVVALRRQEHPTLLTHIRLNFMVKGSSVEAAAVSRALNLSEERLCPVWNMLKRSTTIEASFQIVETPVEMLPIA